MAGALRSSRLGAQVNADGPAGHRPKGSGQPAASQRRAPGHPPRSSRAARSRLFMGSQVADRRSLQWIFEEFRASSPGQTLSRELRSMGSQVPPRHHARLLARLRILKVLRSPGRDRTRERRRSRGDSCLFRRRRASARRTRSPAEGQQRHAPGAPKDQRGLRLYLRRDLPQGTARARPRHAPMRHWARTRTWPKSPPSRAKAAASLVAPHLRGGLIPPTSP